MATYRVVFQRPPITEGCATQDVEAEDVHIGEWCAWFEAANGRVAMVIHANIIETIELKPQTH